MNSEASLPPHLDRIGHHLTAAARELEASTTARPGRRSRSLIALTAAAAAALAGVLVTTAGTSTPPAYALTAQANGSYTLTINDLRTAVPQINAEFAKLGVNAKAIPVTADCTASPSVPLVDFGDASLSESITVDNADIPAGSTAFVAAEQTPSGEVEMAIGTTPNPLPSCLNANSAFGARIYRSRAHH